MMAKMAADRCLSFREVLQDQDYPLRWKEISVANGIFITYNFIMYNLIFCLTARHYNCY